MDDSLFWRFNQLRSLHPLGWNGLQLFNVKLSSDSEPLYFYQTPDERFSLQINELPSGQRDRYQATVKADRYGVVYIDWVPFTLFPDQPSFDCEVDRVYPALARENWKSKAWRKSRIARPGVQLLASRKKLRGYKHLGSLD